MWGGSGSISDMDQLVLLDCVRDNRNRTNNILFTFLGHLQHVRRYMHDMARLRNGLNIRRPKKKMNLMNETRISKHVFHGSTRDIIQECGSYVP